MQPDLRDEHASPIPPGLRAALAEAGCPDDAAPCAQRAALEALAAADPARMQALDGPLLALREREVCDDELPPVIGGIRRAVLVAEDALTATWHGWREGSGERAAVRCLRPRWRGDPVALRRVELGLRVVGAIPGLVPGAPALGDAWPHVAYRLPGLPLADLLPAEDPPETLPLVRWLASALTTLGTLHARGLRFGPLGHGQILLAEHRAFLLWPDPFGLPAGAAADEVGALAARLLALDPWGQHPLAGVVQPWVRCAPASAPEAARLLRRGFADELAAARHHLALRRRSHGHAEGVLRLYRAAVDLRLPPPPARSCVHATRDRTLHLVECDGSTVYGGPSATVPPAPLPALYQPGRGLDLAATRALLRAWARHTDGDEVLRAEVQRTWQGSDAGGGALMRWLAAAARLRRAQLMLAHRLRRA